MIRAYNVSKQPETRPYITGQWRFILVIVFLAMFIGASAYAAEDTLTPQVSEDDDRSSKDSKQCTWACLKWDKLCNVDPRGVYKCQRMCANFGEVCEE